MIRTVVQIAMELDNDTASPDQWDWETLLGEVVTGVQIISTEEVAGRDSDITELESGPMGPSGIVR